jgi:hypothetical protein
MSDTTGVPQTPNAPGTKQEGAQGHERGQSGTGRHLEESEAPTGLLGVLEKVRAESLLDAVPVGLAVGRMVDSILARVETLMQAELAQMRSEFEVREQVARDIEAERDARVPWPPDAQLMARRADMNELILIRNTFDYSARIARGEA